MLCTPYCKEMCKKINRRARNKFSTHLNLHFFQAISLVRHDLNGLLATAPKHPFHEQEYSKKLKIQRLKRVECGKTQKKSHFFINIGWGKNIVILQSKWPQTQEKLFQIQSRIQLCIWLHLQQCGKLLITFSTTNAPSATRLSKNFIFFLLHFQKGKSFFLASVFFFYFLNVFDTGEIFLCLSLHFVLVPGGKQQWNAFG